MGGAGRFEPGLPSIGDGQMLFLLNGVAKLKDEGRMAIIQNGSSLFKGDAGSGESNIRGYLLDHDWLEAIVQLPTDLFYNTGIATYIWIVTKNKRAERQGKVQLIDASQCYEKRRKPLGNKRMELTDFCRDLVMQAYHGFNNFVYKATTADGIEIQVESRVKDNDDLKYRKVFIDRPLRLVYENPEMPDESVKLSESDRMTLKLFIDGYRVYYPGQRMTDRDFFQKIKKAYIEQVDYATNRGLDRNQMERLATLDFVHKAQDLFITGSSGTEKSYLACALGHEACTAPSATKHAKGDSVPYMPMPRNCSER